ncbi:MAG: hypothetical protein HY658_10550 [Actinobacteria bacterium]|nr:hypothetical protein [Actinomycetota bacterium]
MDGTKSSPVLPRTDGEHGALPITVVVAPTAGRLRILPPRRFYRGREWVEAGQPIVRIERGSQADTVVSPVGGRFGGVIGREGEPVAAGQPVAWVEPAGEDGA